MLILGGLLIMMGRHTRSEALFYYFRLEDDWRQSFFPVNDKQISLSFLTDTSSSRGCGKRGNPAGCAGFPREVGREGNRLLVFLAFHGPAFSTAQRRPRFAFS
jgi:hypothetical protein